MTQNKPPNLTAIIVDDEGLARQGLAMRLQEFPQVSIVQICKNGREAIAAIIKHEPDVVFLDIQMPGMSGFEMIREVQADIMPMIIFVTAYDAFAVDAFEAHAVDYLLKPVEKERLQEALSKAAQSKTQQSVENEKQRLMGLVVKLTGKTSAAIDEMLDADEQVAVCADSGEVAYPEGVHRRREDGPHRAGAAR